MKIDNFSGKPINSLGLYSCRSTLKQGFDANDPASDFLRIKPDIAIIFEGYFLNFCKYKNNPTYEKQCDFFHRLLGGEYEYEAKPLVRSRNLYSHLFPDKELYSTFYLFYKKGEDVYFSP